MSVKDLGTAQMKSEGDENAIEIRMMPDDLIQGLDVEPFARTVWHGPKAKSDWQDIFKKAKIAHDKAEYEMVKRGHRRAATTHLAHYNFDRIMDRIQNDGLVWLPIIRTKSYSGFSHKHFPADSRDPNTTVYGVLARNLEDANAFREASNHSQEKPVDHETIGELLGFPKCCCDFFNNIWPTYYDPMWQSAERTKGVIYEGKQKAKVKGSVFCTQLLRYGGFRITSHLPCSFKCEGSIEIGKVWWETMMETDRDNALALLKILSLPVNWSVLHGVAVIETPFFTTWTNSLPTKKKWEINFQPEDAFELVPK